MSDRHIEDRLEDLENDCAKLSAKLVRLEGLVQPHLDHPSRRGVAVPKDSCVRDILRAWLVQHEYAGLYRDDNDGCGCTLEDFVPCDHDFTSCKPGYILKCGICVGPDKDAACEGEHD